MIDLLSLSGIYRIEDDPGIPRAENFTWPFDYRVEVTRDENLYNIANDVTSGGQYMENFIQIRDNKDGTYNLTYDEYGDGNFQSFDNIDEDVLMQHLDHLVKMDVATKTDELSAGETLKESRWRDVDGFFGKAGEIITDKDLKDYWENFHDDDPVLDSYSSYEDWYKDTVSQMSHVVLEESEETPELTTSSLYETFDGTSESLYEILHELGIRSKGELTSFVIPTSVTSIDDKAFYGCRSLTSINIPDSVTSIGDYAFADCYSLMRIAIPNSVTSIGDHAFYDCKLLRSITIPDSVTSISRGAFRYCKSLEKVTLSSSMTSIDDQVFSNCTSLTSIDIPDSVTSIGDEAFKACIELTSVTIPDGVTSIGASAFRYCTVLKNITIPDSVKSIGDYAFSGCSYLVVSTNSEYVIDYCKKYKITVNSLNESVNEPKSLKESMNWTNESEEYKLLVECPCCGSGEVIFTGSLAYADHDEYISQKCECGKCGCEFVANFREVTDYEKLDKELKIKKLKEARFDPNSNRPAETLMKELDARGYDVRERIDGRIYVSAIRDVNGNIYSDDGMKSKFRVEVDGWTPERGEWETEFTANSREELYEKLDKELKVKKLKEDVSKEEKENARNSLVYYETLSKLSSLGVATSKIYNQANFGLTVDIEPTDDAVNKVVSKLESLGFTEVDHYEDDSCRNDSYIVFINEIQGERVVCGIVYNARSNFAFVTAGYDEVEDGEYFEANEGTGKSLNESVDKSSTLSKLVKSGYTRKEIQKFFKDETGLDMTPENSEEFKRWLAKFLNSADESKKEGLTEDNDSESDNTYICAHCGKKIVNGKGHAEDCWTQEALKEDRLNYSPEMKVLKRAIKNIHVDSWEELRALVTDITERVINEEIYGDEEGPEKLEESIKDSVVDRFKANEVDKMSTEEVTREEIINDFLDYKDAADKVTLREGLSIVDELLIKQAELLESKKDKPARKRKRA